VKNGAQLDSPVSFVSSHLLVLLSFFFFVFLILSSFPPYLHRLWLLRWRGQMRRFHVSFLSFVRVELKSTTERAFHRTNTTQRNARSSSRFGQLGKRMNDKSL
jgi:hypothetical protein